MTACIPQRYLFAIEGFLFLTINYMMRYDFGISVPAMFGPPKIVHDTLCNFSTPHTNATKTEPMFHWSKLEKELVKMSNSVGYILSLVPSGILSDQIGCKGPLVFATIISGFCTVIQPPLAFLIGGYGMMLPNFIFGLAQGLGYAALHTLVAVWVPKSERCTLGTIVFTGAYIGKAIDVGISAHVRKSQIGWPLIYYITGSLGIIIGLIILFTTYNHFEENPNVTFKERVILDDYAYRYLTSTKEKKTIPWKEILKSNVVFAVVLATFGHVWGLMLVMVYMPKYLKFVLHYDIATQPFFNIVTNSTLWVLALTTALACDYVINRKALSVTCIRKTTSTLASIVPSLGFVLGAYTNCNRGLALTWLIVAVIFMGFFYSGLKVHQIDIAPNHGGFIGGLSHCAGAIAMLVVERVNTVVITKNSMKEWRKVFWFGLIIMTLTNLYYLVFATAETQPFNKERDPDTESLATTHTTGTAHTAVTQISRIKPEK